MFRHSTMLAFALFSLLAASVPARADVVRFPKDTAPAFLIDLLATWATQEDQYGGLQVFPNDHATAIYLSMTRDPQYADHPLKEVATAIGSAAGVTEFTRQEPATLSGESGEAFYGLLKNQRGVTLDVKMVLVPMDRDLWAVEMTMTPRNLAGVARNQLNQMVGRITLTKTPSP